MAKIIFNRLLTTAIKASFLGFPFASKRWYRFLQVLLCLDACKLHIYSFLRTKGFPIFDIFPVPFILVPELRSVGARPK